MQAKALYPRAKIVKPKKCKAPGCTNEFFPARPMQKACGTACAIAIASALKEKERRKDRIADIKQTKQALEEFKNLPKLHAEAQKAANDYVRWRDKDKPCISCGTGGNEKEALTGGYWDCGHYRSRGAASHLRYDLRNMSKQCKRCNSELAGNVVMFRRGLIERIGAEEVEALENDNTPHKWTKEEVRAIKAKFVQMLKDAKQ